MFIFRDSICKIFCECLSARDGISQMMLTAACTELTRHRRADRLSYHEQSRLWVQASCWVSCHGDVDVNKQFVVVEHDQQQMTKRILHRRAEGTLHWPTPGHRPPTELCTTHTHTDTHDSGTLHWSTPGNRPPTELCTTHTQADRHTRLLGTLHWPSPGNRPPTELCTHTGQRTHTTHRHTSLTTCHFTEVHQRCTQWKQTLSVSQRSVKPLARFSENFSAKTEFKVYCMFI